MATCPRSLPPRSASSSARSLLPPIARAADDAGVAELWLWEDCFYEGALTAATAALLSTEKITVGIGLMPVPLRNPALAAMEIATVERLAPGRLVTGFGHGVLDWMGQTGALVASPLTLLREHVTAVRALLDGETVNVAGRYVSLADVTLAWPPAASTEIDPRGSGLATRISDRIAELADAGADAIAIQTPADAPDPRVLFDALPR